MWTGAPIAGCCRASFGGFFALEIQHFQRANEAQSRFAGTNLRIHISALRGNIRIGKSLAAFPKFRLACRIPYSYTIWVIKSYRHKGLRAFAESGSRAGIQPRHAERLRRLLTALDVAAEPQDMAAPGYNLHALSGNLSGQWAVKVDGNWRLTFAFEQEDVILLDYQDYH